MCFLRPAEHPARNRTSLAGLEQDLLFFGPPHINYPVDTAYHPRWDAVTIKVMAKTQVGVPGSNGCFVDRSLSI